MVVDTAIELLALNGYAATSMSMIAEASEVSKAVLYDCFPEGKHELYRAVMERLTQRFEVAIVSSDISTMLEDSLSFSLREPYAARVLFAEPPVADGSAHAIYADAQRHIVETIAWSMKVSTDRIDTLACLLAGVVMNGASGHTEAAVVMISAATSWAGRPSTQEPTIAAIRRAYRPSARALLRVVRGSASG